VLVGPWQTWGMNQGPLSTQQNGETFPKAQDVGTAGTAASRPAAEVACGEGQQAGCSACTQPRLLGKLDIKTRE